MKRVGCINYGRYNGADILKEDSNHFYIKYNGQTINVLDLDVDPDSEITFGYDMLTRKEALNLGMSIGMGGMLGLLNFKVPQGASVFTVRWLNGESSDFEFATADDDKAGNEFFKEIAIMVTYEHLAAQWQRMILDDDLDDLNKGFLLELLDNNKRNIIEDFMVDYAKNPSTAKMGVMIIVAMGVPRLLGIFKSLNYLTEHEIHLILSDMREARNLDGIKEAFESAADYLSDGQSIKNMTEDNIRKIANHVMSIAEAQPGAHPEVVEEAVNMLNEGYEDYIIIDYLFREKCRMFFDIALKAVLDNYK